MGAGGNTVQTVSRRVFIMSRYRFGWFVLTITAHYDYIPKDCLTAVACRFIPSRCECPGLPGRERRGYS